MRFLSEKELVIGCRKNVRKYQEELYMRFFEKMFDMCLRHSQDEDTAMSILNDGFLNVFKNIENYREEGHLESWIKKIIYNKIIDFYRVKSNMTNFSELKDTLFIIPEDNSLDYDELYNAINELPPKYNQIFKLHSIDGYKHEEIAEKMNISEGASKWYLSSARKKLQEKLQHKYLNVKKL